jgi:hypothetical protein
MAKVLTNSLGKIYINQAGKALASENCDVVVATNTTGSAISTGDKVWIEPSGNNYNLINFRAAYNNYTIVGNLTVNTSTGVATGFSLNNYLQLPTPFNPANQPWEVQVKFSSDNISQSLALFHSMPYKSGGIYGIVFDIEDSKFVFGISINGSSWLFAQSGTYTPQSNTVYWVKFGWTGTEYYLDYSTDGTNYTRDITYTSSTPAYQNNTATEFGLFSWNSYEGRYLNGPLYLEDCYIKINGLEWWNPRVISITEDTLTGYAQENIENSASGKVKTVLGA